MLKFSEVLRMLLASIPQSAAFEHAAQKPAVTMIAKRCSVTSPRGLVRGMAYLGTT